MTEADWLTAPHPTPMLEFLQGSASERKLRLFGCAAVRRQWALLTHMHGQRAVELAERFADELAQPQSLNHAAGKAHWAIQYASKESQFVLRAACAVARIHSSDNSWQSICDAAANIRSVTTTNSNEELAQAELLRDIFGNPFGPSYFDPSWRTSTVLALAAQMYASRDFTRMPILADALQDAGSPAYSELIRHCRGPGPHVRGCHVLDIILQKT